MVISEFHLLYAHRIAHLADRVREGQSKTEGSGFDTKTVQSEKALLRRSRQQG
jgi:hypothetical protein